MIGYFLQKHGLDQLDRWVLIWKDLPIDSLVQGPSPELHKKSKVRGETVPDHLAKRYPCIRALSCSIIEWALWGRGKKNLQYMDDRHWASLFTHCAFSVYEKGNSLRLKLCVMVAQLWQKVSLSQLQLKSRWIFVYWKYAAFLPIHETRSSAMSLNDVGLRKAKFLACGSHITIGPIPRHQHI